MKFFEVADSQITSAPCLKVKSVAIKKNSEVNGLSTLKQSCAAGWPSSE